MKITFEVNSQVVVRWFVGLLLLWAAVSKLANLQTFYGDLLSYQLPLPDIFLRLVAISLPWLELLCGLMLVARFRVEPALACAIGLFAVFLLATGQAWARGLNIDCGCFNLRAFGLADDSSAVKVLHAMWFAFLRAIVLLLAGIYLWRHETRLTPKIGPAAFAEKPT